MFAKLHTKLSNMSSTTDKYNCPTLLKILSHFTAIWNLISTLQNHCYYQHKITCCSLWLDQTRRINEAHQRAALGCDTYSSAPGRNCGEVTQMGNPVYTVVEVCTSRSTVTALWLSAIKESLCCSQIHLAGSHLWDSLLSATSYRAPHIIQRFPPPLPALAFLPAISLLKKPSQPNALCKMISDP